MPLQKSSSPKAFKSNVRVLMDELKAGTSPHVKSRAQALAIAFSEKRRAKHAKGGKVKGYDAGGAATDPVTAVINALQSGSNQTGAATGSNPGMNNPAPPPTNPGTPTPANAGIGSGPGLQNSPFNLAPSPPATNTTPALTPQNMGVVGNGLQQQPQPQTQQLTPAQMGLAMNKGGVPGAAMGGMQGLQPAPWFVRQESRNLVHSGPIMSAVPGRTDRHNMSLASGSYVMPAAAVSHLGQSNTMAGMKILDNMFGAKTPSMGPGAPRPPRMMGIPGDKGGARGEGTGSPVPVVTAGGEYVITPAQVARLGDGNLKHGHKILDAWVMKLHKDAAKTIKKLPPPAKA